MSRKFILLALLPLTAWGEIPVLPLTQAIDEALRNNQLLSREQVQAHAAKVALGVAGADFSVQWNPFVRSNLTDGNRQAAAGVAMSKKLGATNGSLSLGVENAYSEGVEDAWRPAVSVEWRQPLLQRAGGNQARLESRQSRSRWMNALRSLHEQRAHVALQVMEGFEQLRLLQARKVLEQRRVTQLTQLHRLASARERQGRGTRIDSLRADQQRVESVTRLSQLQQQARLAQSSLNELMGRPPEAIWTPEEIPLPLPSLPEADSLVQIALSHRLDLARAIEDLVSRERDIAVARKNVWPRLDLVLRYERFDLADDWVGDGLGEDQWLVGFSGDQGAAKHRRAAALEEAGLMQDDATLAVAASALGIQREVYQRWVTLQQARLTEEGVARSASPAEKRLRLAQRLFEMGRGSHFDVADAEGSWAANRLEVLQSRAGQRIAHLRLRHALGLLLAVPPDLVANLERDGEALWGQP